MSVIMPSFSSFILNFQLSIILKLINGFTIVKKLSKFNFRFEDV